MVSFPNAKINLGLNVIEKRADGFHNIETIFIPISIKDALEIVISENAEDVDDFVTTGLLIDGDISKNLCVKAHQLLKKNFSIPPIKMHLHKAIPMGAGLGGGSADGAFALTLLNDKLALNIPTPQLINYALQLGSDCPFFIMNKSCFATSRGEEMHMLQLDLSAYDILIINPKIHIATAWAFANITPANPKKSIQQIIQQPIETWKTELVNDFEEPVFKQYPTIKNIKETLYNNHAVYAAMTGTGSTVFGIFKRENKPDTITFDKEYFVKWVTVI